MATMYNLPTAYETVRQNILANISTSELTQAIQNGLDAFYLGDDADGEPPVKLHQLVVQDAISDLAVAICQELGIETPYKLTTED